MCKNETTDQIQSPHPFSLLATASVRLLHRTLWTLSATRLPPPPRTVLTSPSFCSLTSQFLASSPKPPLDREADENTRLRPSLCNYVRTRMLTGAMWFQKMAELGRDTRTSNSRGILTAVPSRYDSSVTNVPYAWPLSQQSGRTNAT